MIATAPRCVRLAIEGSTAPVPRPPPVRRRSVKLKSSRPGHATPRRPAARSESVNMAAQVTVKNVKKGAKPVDTTMKEPSAQRDLVQAPDLVMQRKLKGQRLIGGRR